MSVMKASEEYGVQLTLHEKVTGKVALQVKGGSKNYLMDEEEASLVDFLIGYATISYAKSRKDVLAIAQQIVVTRKPGVEIRKKGWESFGAGIQKYPFVMPNHCLTPELLPTIPM